MARGTEALGHLHRGPERQQRPDPHLQWRVLAEHLRIAEPLLAQARDERLGVARRRDPLDDDRVHRGAGLLAEAQSLVAGLVQLALNPLSLPRHDKRTELYGEARLGSRRRDLRLRSVPTTGRADD